MPKPEPSLLYSPQRRFGEKNDSGSGVGYGRFDALLRVLGSAKSTSQVKLDALIQSSMAAAVSYMLQAGWLTMFVAK
jgi:hypothetical protein